MKYCIKLNGDYFAAFAGMASTPFRKRRELLFGGPKSGRAAHTLSPR